MNVSLGGGELGQGFYTGEHLHEAKAWAFQMRGDKRANVVEFDTPDDLVEKLDLRVLEHWDAMRLRARIKKAQQTRTHRVGVDMIWAPIVGTERATGHQYKWESSVSEALLNGSSTARTVV